MKNLCQLWYYFWDLSNLKVHIGIRDVSQTTLMMRIVREFKEDGSVAVCSTTGISAIKLEGITIHSWSGVNADVDYEIVMNRIRGSSALQERWYELAKTYYK